MRNQRQIYFLRGVKSNLKPVKGNNKINANINTYHYKKANLFGKNIFFLYFCITDEDK